MVVVQKDIELGVGGRRVRNLEKGVPPLAEAGSWEGRGGRNERVYFSLSPPLITASEIR